MARTKEISIKSVEVAANDALGFNIDAEGVKSRSLDDSQIALLSITPVDSPVPDSVEGVGGNHAKIPPCKFASNVAVPLEYLAAMLKIAKKSGATHIQLFAANDRPLALGWTFSAVGKEGTEKDFQAWGWLAPRVHQDGEGGELPPNSVMMPTAKEVLEEATKNGLLLNSEKAVQAGGV